MSPQAAFATCLLLVACGGQSTGEHAGEGGTAQGARGGTTGGGSGSGGTGETAGSTAGSTGGTGGRITPIVGGSSGSAGDEPVSCPVDIPFECVESCEADGYESLPAFCPDGSWQCPGGSRPLDTCPSNSCRRDHQVCCNPATGNIEETPCNDGVRAECPAGTNPTTYAGGCIPAAEGVTDCADLDGRPCSSPDLECHNAGRCTTNCDCQENENGNLAYFCSTVLC